MTQIELDSLGERIRTQDNRCTADPLFVVFQKKRIRGLDPSYTEDHTWVDDHGEEADAQELRVLNNAHGRGERVKGNWNRTGYMDIDVFVTACFSEAGAQAYIAANGHNLKKPHIYVETLYRNAEMIGLREWLKGLGVTGAEPPVGPSAVSLPAVGDAAAVPNAGPILGYFTRGPLKWMLTEREGGMLKGVDITPLGKVHTMHMAESSADVIVMINDDDYCLACWNCMPVGETCAVCGRINKGGE